VENSEIHQSPQVGNAFSNKHQSALRVFLSLKALSCARNVYPAEIWESLYVRVCIATTELAMETFTRCQESDSPKSIEKKIEDWLGYYYNSAAEFHGAGDGFDYLNQVKDTVK
jgi:hypothetical protein